MYFTAIIVPLLEVEGAAIKRRGGLYKGKKKFRCVKTPTEFMHKDTKSQCNGIVEQE